MFNNKGTKKTSRGFVLAQEVINGEAVPRYAGSRQIRGSCGAFWITKHFLKAIWTRGSFRNIENLLKQEEPSKKVRWMIDGGSRYGGHGRPLDNLRLDTIGKSGFIILSRIVIS